MTDLQAQRLAASLGISEKPISIGKGIYCLHTHVRSSDQASEWLATRNDGNRPMKNSSISSYKDDMVSNRWKLTHEGIAFDKDGNLQDGQNRLMACILADKSFETFVFFGLQKDSGIVINEGVNRSAKDAAHFAGYKITAKDIASIKNAYRGLDHLTTKISNSLSVNLITEWGDATKWLSEILDPKITNAAMRGAILRAYYFFKTSTERRRLAKFCEILTTGQYDNIQKNTAPSRLRDRILEGKKPGKKLWGESKVSYGLAEQAIRHFMDEAPCALLRQTTEELFPINFPKTYSIDE